ncbi:MAG: HD-GYP domain-containing protein [Acidimicrobiia bacterium]|nr:HD-GYP domain-containing protein [Acidimicrobiia bacterium]
MSEQLIKQTLSGLRGAVTQLALYPTEHPAVEGSIERAAFAASSLVESAGETVLTILGDSLYQGQRLLAHTSLEFNGFFRTMQARGIDSLTFDGFVSRADVRDLTEFLAGKMADVPAEGTIRLNESPFTSAQLAEGGEISGLRKNYARSLDVLRGIGQAIGAGQEFDLSGATLIVEQLVEQTISQPGASVLLASMKSHDEYTFYHSVNVCILAIALGRRVGLDEQMIGTMALGALLHDIGKLRVASSILQFPGRLDAEQWAEIKLHPQEGATAILAAAAPGQEVASVVALEHHRRFDGAGYPVPSRNREQHLFSRVVTAADVYDALTTRRSYRRADTPHQAIEVLRQGAGSHFDPIMVHQFIGFTGAYPPGSFLQLADGTVAMVTVTVTGELPEGLVVRSPDGVTLDEPEPIRLDLSEPFTHMTAMDAGIDPASLLERVATAPVG